MQNKNKKYNLLTRRQLAPDILLCPIKCINNDVAEK